MSFTIEIVPAEKFDGVMLCKLPRGCWAKRRSDGAIFCRCGYGSWWCLTHPGQSYANGTNCTDLCDVLPTGTKVVVTVSGGGEGDG